MRKTTTTVLLTVLIAFTIAISSCNQNTPKLGYIKSNEIYNEFELKKELAAKLTTIENRRKAILDSLGLSLKIRSQQLQQHSDQKQLMQFQIQQEDYFAKRKEFEEDTQRLRDQYSGEIWKQINQYVADYGKENGYGFIYGATGDGSLMFADDKYDLTKVLGEYVNNRYKGEKK